MDYAGPRHCRGLTFWGWLYVLATLGVILMVGIKVLPVYVANYQIQSVLTWAANLEELQGASKYKIRDRIQRRFTAGYVDAIEASDIKVKRVDKGRVLSVRYEAMVPLFGNVSLHLEFHETALMRAGPH